MPDNTTVPTYFSEPLLEEAAKRFPPGSTYEPIDVYGRPMGSTYIVSSSMQPYWYESGLIALASGKGLVYSNGKWANIVTPKLEAVSADSKISIGAWELLSDFPKEKPSKKERGIKLKKFNVKKI
jgi:hypothetical protein